MPSVSRKQHNFMLAAAHGGLTKKTQHRVGRAVAREFLLADKAAGKYQGMPKPRKPRT